MPLPAPSDAALGALAFAKAQIGKPYVWGGTGPNGYDCSGLAMAAYRSQGIDITRTTYTQVNEGVAVPSAAELIPGDLVFPDAGHVQIYAGGGQIVEAQHTGTTVLQDAMWGFWRARRIAGTGSGTYTPTTTTSMSGGSSSGGSVATLGANLQSSSLWRRVGIGALGIGAVVVGVIVFARKPLEQAGSVAAKAAVLA